MPEFTWTNPTQREEVMRRFAGAMAESAVVEIELRAPGRPPRVLRARETDLPALLRDSAVGVEFHWSEPARSSHRRSATVEQSRLLITD